MSKNVLITGTSGFVGANLVPYLEGLHKLITPIRSELSLPLPKYDVIVHLAGKAHDIKKVAEADVYYEANYELTKALFDDFIASEAEIFIFVSSVKAVADKVSSPLREDFVPKPETHYGKSKLMGEEYIANQVLPEGKSFYILRPCMIHGPGNKGNLNLLYQIVAKGIPYPLAAFKNKRSFLSVENLCFVIRELIENDNLSSGIYNVADDCPVSTNELVQLIARASGRNAKLLKLYPGFIKFIAKIGDILRLPLTTERLEKLTENFIVDNSKIKKALRKELPLTSQEGIIITVNSFNKLKK